jgi:hypothetical protein
MPLFSLECVFVGGRKCVTDCSAVPKVRGGGGGGGGAIFFLKIGVGVKF